MTTSGTASWNPSVSQIICGALRLLSAIATGETPPDDEFQDALDALNGLIKTWGAGGVHVWTQTDATVFLTPGQPQYEIGIAGTDYASATTGVLTTTLATAAAAAASSVTLASVTGIAQGSVLGVWLDAGTVFWTTVSTAPSGSTVALADALPSAASEGVAVAAYGAPMVRPLKITGARLVNLLTGVESPLVPMSRLDYANLSGKVATGIPAQYFYDPQLVNGIMSLFPAPSSGPWAVKFTCQRPLQDFDTAANTADVPQEWISALRFALAVELAPEYDCPSERFTVIKGLADEKFKMVSAWDTEPAGTSTYPFSQGIYKVIAGALRLCGGCGPHDVPDLGLINNGLFALNSMVSSWQATGIHVWAEEDVEVFLQRGQVRYLLGGTSPDHAAPTASVARSWLATASAKGSEEITLDDASDVSAGDTVGVWLDSGVIFWTTAADVAAPIVTLAASLPGPASASARVAAYPLALARPLRLPAGRRARLANPGGQDIEIPLIPMSRIDYGRVPNKTTPGTVTQFFYDPQLGSGVLSVWPAPSNSASSLRFTAQLPLSTFGSLSDAPDFPDEWLAAMRWNLAVELWPEFNGPAGWSQQGMGAAMNAQQFSILKQEATSKLMTAQGWDRETQSVLFGAAADASGRAG